MRLKIAGGSHKALISDERTNQTPEVASCLKILPGGRRVRQRGRCSCRPRRRRQKPADQTGLVRAKTGKKGYICCCVIGNATYL